MERIKISPYARRTAREQGVDIAGLTGTGPGGRILWRDVDAAAKAPRRSGGQRAAVAAAADVTELLAGLATLQGALTLPAFVERAAARSDTAVAVRHLAPGIGWALPALAEGETAVLTVGALEGGRLPLYLTYDPAALADSQAEGYLSTVKAALEQPLTLLL